MWVGTSPQVKQKLPETKIQGELMQWGQFLIIWLLLERVKVVIHIQFPQKQFPIRPLTISKISISLFIQYDIIFRSIYVRPWSPPTRVHIMWQLISLQEKGEEKSSFYDDVGYENLVNVLLDLFIAGTDTSSLTLTFGIIFLTKYANE